MASRLMIDQRNQIDYNRCDIILSFAAIKRKKSRNPDSEGVVGLCVLHKYVV